MDIGSIGNLSPALSQARTGDAVALLVMKKAIDAQAQSALQLLEALPPATSNPAHLGNRVDIRV
ncbi:MAG: YjfB family protein [Desulfobulbus sp.]|nr:YjfB family protein [Desulfobulbus sp.]